MIFWFGKRFACQTCSKGHRATKCSHTNRTLSEIKSKGRPTSQCPSCRSKVIY
ncbi:copper fist DNA binding domain-containing protein [Globomyces pollinis-pini]|nr:copper fist DNA binding domain-containing protein [Globomyces pollinis-pini]